MSLIHLYDPLRSFHDLERFADSNFSDHIIISDALFRVLGINVPVLDIRTVLPDALAVWSSNHQALHNELSLALRTPIVDISDVDYRDPEQLDLMRAVHAEEHAAWHNILGI